MIAGIGLEQIDSILDQLESLSQTEQSRRRFYDAVISRLRMLLNAHSVAYLVRVGDATWSCLSFSGSGPNVSADHGASTILVLDGSDSYDRAWFIDTDRCGLVVPVDPTVRNQIILVRFESTIDEVACEDLSRLIQAFSELIQERNRRDQDLFFQQRFHSLQNTLSALAQASEVGEAAAILVNDIQSILAADRVSLAEYSEGRIRLVAVSGRSNQVLPTQTTQSIEQACLQAKKSAKPQICTSLTSLDSASRKSAGLLNNYVACALDLLTASSANRSKPQSDDDHSPMMLIEWNDPDRFLTGLSLVQYTLPTIAPLWKVRVNTLRGASWRWWLPLDRQLRTVRLARSWIKPIAVLVGLCLAFLGVSYPVEFRLELAGTLEPELQRTIFAAHDGYIEQLTVSDNSIVKQGQSVATMRSPQLDMDILEVRGELRANQEKHDALSIGLNQFNSDTVDGQAKQQSLGAELKQLEIQRSTLESRLTALEDERRKLNLLTPIDGVIVSKEIARMLDSRPIRRGDAVMRIADPEGKWRLALKVKDSDAGHLRQAFSNASRSQEAVKSELARVGSASSQGSLVTEVNPEATSRSLPIDFVIVSQPSRKFKASLNWISSSARNPDGQGVILDALADIESDATVQAHIGATAQAYVNCGTRPFWYVWSRPLWESIQRKLWF